MKLHIVVLIQALVVMCGCATTPNHALEILTYKQYASLEHGTPYILEFSVGDGALLLYGVRHTFDSHDPQIADIKSEWERFSPTIAYNEGGNPPAEASIKDAVERWGEGGLVRLLSAANHVPVATFEPLRTAETDALLRKYSPEQVKVFLALRTFITFRKSKSERSATEFMNDVLGDKAGLKVRPNNVHELGSSYAKLFPGHIDWREVQDSWFDPAESFQYTNEAQNVSGYFRDQHIFGVIVDRARRGDRVFAVIGASHVLVQEPALVAALGEPARKRDGGRWIQL